MSEVIAYGATNQSIYFKLTEISTGSRLEGAVAADDSGTFYTRERENLVGMTLVNGLPDSPWTEGLFAEITSGLYRLDVPNAAFTANASVTKVLITLEITGAHPETKEIELVDPAFLAGGGGGSGPNTDGAPITQGTVGATITTFPTYRELDMLDNTVRKDYF